MAEVGMASWHCIGAGEGNRTLVSSLGSYSSTIELHPQDALKSIPLASPHANGAPLLALHWLSLPSLESEAAADAGEGRGVAAAVLAHGGAEADIRIKSEQAGARAQ